VSSAVKVVLAFLLLAAGALIAVATVAVHQRWWGLLLALAATFSGHGVLPARWWGRLMFAAGWAGMIGYVTMPSPGEGFLIGADAKGYALLGAVLIMVGWSLSSVALADRGVASQGQPPPRA
jgi:hypothetical protein